MRFSKRFLFDQLINIVASVISAYLLYDEIYLFISKPTYSSKSNEKLQPKHFPDFFLCPIPAFDLDNLKKHGYSSSYNFMKGKFHNGDKVKSWKGNSTDTHEKILDDISVLKSIKDCPYFSVMFKHNFKTKYVFASFTLTSPVFPHGRCCKVFMNEEETTSPVLRAAFGVKVNENFPSIEGFRLFMVSVESSHILKMGNFNKNRMELKVTLIETGYEYYKINIKEEYDLKEDPKVSCENYPTRNGYGQVHLNLNFLV